MAFAEIRVASLIRVDNLLFVKRNEIMPTTKGNDQMVDSLGLKSLHDKIFVINS